MTKSCSRCGLTKLLSDFPKAASCKDGHRSYCKKCRQVYMAAWYDENRELHYARSRKWVTENQEQNRQYKRKHNAKAVADGRSAEYKRRWRAANQERSRASVSARRRRLAQATPRWVDKAAIIKIYEEAVRQGLTVDHIVPIKHKDVCGLHVPWNLTLVPASDNYSKGNVFNGVRSKEHKTNG